VPVIDGRILRQNEEELELQKEKISAQREDNYDVE